MLSARLGKSARSPPNPFLVVAIGASAGGLDACRKFVAALRSGHGMAFILVQHLDPTHESMMVDLLRGHTSMMVCQAVDGMMIEPEHLYLIPPGTALSIAKGMLHVSEPTSRHGTRLPFDFLLDSLAREYGPRAVAIVLSGTGADGSQGILAVRDKGGLVIAQDPTEASYDGMPQNAIATGAVRLTLPIAGIAEALIAHQSRGPASDASAAELEGEEPGMRDIIALIHAKTGFDFTLYKTGTLRRRMDRRMAMASINQPDLPAYLALLRQDSAELATLSKDLLINVTSFFRDPAVFELLSAKILPELVRNHVSDSPIRIWSAGCSTGEETYSLAMLFVEEIAAAQRNIKLQVFASDLDPDAVARAREGVYPHTIANDIAPVRLARFFTKEEQCYRIKPDLRAMVVFTVQDVLADPPFSRLDFISCRNLLIYLKPEAQARIITLFHFALCEGSYLLLGSSETLSSGEDRFETVSKPDRLYRHIARSRPGELAKALNAGGVFRASARPGQDAPPSRQSAMAELCRQRVLDEHAPAAVLINRKRECQYFLGPIERFLRTAPGYPSHDILAMAHTDFRTKLRSAIEQSDQENRRVLIPAARTLYEGKPIRFAIEARPEALDGERMMLVCFLDDPAVDLDPARPPSMADMPRVVELEHELSAVKTELQGAIRSLERANEEQAAINEEALSVQEEYQSTNEELLTSKEELQSLNEELTALNAQLQETLEHQRQTANDLENILYSTDVATLFLDEALNIRFFTPSTKSLFNVIASDIGRPLDDLKSLGNDDALGADARLVIQNSEPIDREFETESGVCYIRRVMPYRTPNDGVAGVVITFTDNTERKRIAKALEAAKLQAERANNAKSRFLAAASHDLRQPLQTLALLQGLLAKLVEGEKAERLVALLDPTLSAMSGMLNTLLDINQIDSGRVKPELLRFSMDELFHRLSEEFVYHAQAQGIILRVVPCSVIIETDPRLLEQMIRNLLSNALKYTESGKVLLGCRRRSFGLEIQVWDTGIGIIASELNAIFDEYHQVDNAARERGRGLGLGLAIVQRLGLLLGYPVKVRSRPDKGSVFSIEVTQATKQDSAPRIGVLLPAVDMKQAPTPRTGMILVVEDDADMRQLINLLLLGEGHQTAIVADGTEALALMARGGVTPDLILADYNLPNGLDGLALVGHLRSILRWQVPAIILTGDISTATLRDVSLQQCVQLSKPIKLPALIQTIAGLLPASRPELAPPATEPEAPVIFIIDDDRHVRDGIRSVLEQDGRLVEDFASGEAFLDTYRPRRQACLLVDAYLPGMTGGELLTKLDQSGRRLPAVMITGSSDVHIAVEAMKAGASDFLEKPVSPNDLLTVVDRALELAADSSKLIQWREAATQHVASLTPRQREIMDLVLAGHPSKNIAADLGVSRRTVENHRAAIMKKTGVKSLPALARLALAATSNATSSV
jgi:two-component system CheB/CheR fusion protein